MLLNEDVAMRTIDFAPLYRSTVGFDQLFEMLDSSIRPDWPPYDIEKLGEDRYRITMAVAGFGLGDIELTQQGNTLLVVGEKRDGKEERQLLYKGIADRSFRQTFNLADYVRVADAALVDGLLAIDLVREVPEQLKPRRIEIAAPADAPAQPKQIDQQAKAA
jgi:molecular chaperone IbpA